MRLKTQLDKLEAEMGSGRLSSEAFSLLVSLVGRVDALFWPQRDSGLKGRVSEIKKLRQGYQTQTIGVDAAGFGSEAWKESHYARKELESAGLAIAIRGKKEITGMVVAPLGYAIVRKMLGHDIELAKLYWAKLKLLMLEGEPCRKPCWISEAKLFFDRAWHELSGCCSEWFHLTDILMPGLIDGSIGCHHDTLGRVYYLVAEVSPAQHRMGENLDFKLTEEIEVSFSTEQIEGIYFKAFNQTFDHLSKLEASDGGITVPLPATWG